jgi:hypothetical protein
VEGWRRYKAKKRSENKQTNKQIEEKQVFHLPSPTNAAMRLCVALAERKQESSSIYVYICLCVCVYV